MKASIRRRLGALERPGGRSRLSCELSRLDSAAPPAYPPSPCTHWQRRTLAEELLELNTTKEQMP